MSKSGAAEGPPPTAVDKPAAVAGECTVERALDHKHIPVSKLWDDDVVVLVLARHIGCAMAA